MCKEAEKFPCQKITRQCRLRRVEIAHAVLLAALFDLYEIPFRFMPLHTFTPKDIRRIDSPVKTVLTLSTEPQVGTAAVPATTVNMVHSRSDGYGGTGSARPSACSCGCTRTTIPRVASAASHRVPARRMLAALLRIRLGGGQCLAQGRQTARFF